MAALRQFSPEVEKSPDQVVQERLECVEWLLRVHAQVVRHRVAGPHVPHPMLSPSDRLPHANETNMQCAQGGAFLCDPAYTGMNWKIRWRIAPAGPACAEECKVRIAR